MKVRIDTFAFVGVVLLGLVISGATVAQGKPIKGADARKAKKKAEPKKPAPSGKSDKAVAVYAAAMEVYRMGRWKEASKGLEGFIKGYKTNENIPLAHLQLAHCYQKLGNKAGRIKEVDTVIKKFPESKAATYAWNNKLVSALNNQEYDKFISLYAKVAKKWKRPPLSVSDHLDWRNVGSFYWSYRQTSLIWPHRRTSGYNIKFNTKMHWAGQVLKAANNEDRAAKLLRIFEPTFKKYGNSLPVNWKFAHVLLLRKCGPKKANAAIAQYKKYVQGWKKDPGAITFMIMEAEWCQGRKSPSIPPSAKSVTGPKPIVIDYDKRADEIYGTLIKKYRGYTSLGNFLQKRLSFLVRQRRYDDFFKLANWYLDNYPYGSHRDKVLVWWRQVAIWLPRDEKTKLQTVLKLLEEETKHYPLNPQKMGANMFNRIDVLLMLKDISNAKKLAQKLISREYWCAGNFNKIVQFSSRSTEFRSVVDKARTQYKIPVENPKSGAKVMYNKFRVYMNSGKVRHMEEIVENMYRKHRNDAYTILAIDAIVDYFYKKVLHGQRNKWVNIMIQTYPYHPLTESVLNSQIISTRGSKSFENLQKFTELAMSHFPGSANAPKWFSYRVECFGGLSNKSDKEYIRKRMSYIQGRLDKRTKSGEVAAIVLLGNYYTDSQSGKTYTERCEYWAGVAENWKSKYQGVVCNSRAFHCAYRLPTSRWHWNLVDFIGAAKAAKVLRKQKLDPELQWKMQFEDINMLTQSRTPEGAKMALVELQKRLRNGHYVNISDRLDLLNLGVAIGTNALVGKGQGVISKLKGFCKGRNDNRKFLLMLANIHRTSGKPGKAGTLYLKVGAYEPRPIDRWIYHQNAVGCYWSQGQKVRDKYSAVQKKYVKQLSTAQYAASLLYYQWGSTFWGDKLARRKAAGIWNKLRLKYPDSSFWGSARKKMGN